MEENVLQSVWQSTRQLGRFFRLGLFVAGVISAAAAQGCVFGSEKVTGPNGQPAPQDTSHGAKPNPGACQFQCPVGTIDTTPRPPGAFNAPWYTAQNLTTGLASISHMACDVNGCVIRGGDSVQIRPLSLANGFTPQGHDISVPISGAGTGGVWLGPNNTFTAQLAQSFCATYQRADGKQTLQGIRINPGDDALKCVSTNPDVIYGFSHSGVFKLNTSTGTSVRLWPASGQTTMNSITGGAISPSGKVIAVLGADANNVVFMDTTGLVYRQPFKTGTGNTPAAPQLEVAFSRGDSIAVSVGGNAGYVWRLDVDPTTKAPKRSLVLGTENLGVSGLSVAVCPKDTLVTFGTSDGSVEYFDLAFLGFVGKDSTKVFTTEPTWSQALPKRDPVVAQSCPDNAMTVSAENTGMIYLNRVDPKKSSPNIVPTWAPRLMIRAKSNTP